MKADELGKADNILNEEIQNNFLVNTRAKLSFLQDQKDRLDIVISQLKQNNDLLRNINSQLIAQAKFDPQSLLNTLSQQNKTLQANYGRILQENQNMSSQILLLQQIMDQTSLESQTILKQYQAKIIELRRSVQMKEVSVQELQRKLGSPESNVTAPFNNVTVLFFNEIDELKKVIDRLTTSNKKLQSQNYALKQKNKTQEQRLNLLQALTLRSKLTFEQFKHYYIGDKRSRSAPKKELQLSISNLKQSQGRLSEGPSKSTWQMSQCQSIIPDKSTKLILYKQILQSDHLKALCQELKTKLKAEQLSKNKISCSYAQLDRKLKDTTKELNYFKAINSQMLMLMSHRTQKNRSKSHDKGKAQKLLEIVEKSNKIRQNSSTRKQYWKSISQTIKIQKSKVLLIKKRCRQIKRSISCTIDYKMPIEQQLTLAKKMATEAKKDSQSKKRMEQFTEIRAFDDLTMMMDDGIGCDISIIGPCIPKKTNYAQWKSSQRKSELPNMTIVQEGIL